MKRAIVLLFATLLLAALLPAQDLAVPTEKREELNELQQGLYPDFLRAAEPPPQDAVEPEDLEADPDAPQLLIADLASTTTWLAVRTRLPPQLEELRLLFLTGTPDEVNAHFSAINSTIELIDRMAAYHVPVHAATIERTLRRIERQLEYLREDYGADRTRRLASTDELLRREVEGLDRLLDRAEIEASLPGESEWLPSDWSPGLFTDPDFADGLAAWSTGRLVDGIEQRRQMLLRSPESGDVRLAVEMSDLARELSRRAPELSITSQAGYRNAALRLDVLAEGLGDFLREQRASHARRHLMEIGSGLEKVRAYRRLAE